MKATCCFGAVFANTTGDDNMLLLRDCWSRQRIVGELFAYSTGEGNVFLRDCFLRVPLVKATCCCVTVLCVPPVKATCCCVTVLCVPPVKVTCC